MASILVLFDPGFDLILERKNRLNELKSAFTVQEIGYIWAHTMFKIKFKVFSCSLRIKLILGIKTFDEIFLYNASESMQASKDN